MPAERMQAILQAGEAAMEAYFDGLEAPVLDAQVNTGG
jgi:hypothetical protein